MTKIRLISLLFAFAYIAVPTGAVYLQVKLSHRDHADAVESSVMPVVPAVLRARPAERDAPVAL